MKFSVCIPNYNYERYLGRTIRSVLDQTYQDFEILVSDNASPDGSVELVKSFGDPRIHVQVNSCNVGFAGNLDRAARMATGQRMIMLSSDDLMRSEALATYRKLFDILSERGEKAIATATWDVIDSNDKIIGERGPNPNLWHESDRRPELEKQVGAPVYGVSGDELLRRCLRELENPFNFAATVYSKRLYDSVEGYGGGRLYNPDKWFHWKVLSVAEMAYFVDRKLFAYRWHGDNQVSQEGATSALKFLVDDYVATLELEAPLLARLGLSREAVAKAFIEHDIAGHGLTTLARGQRVRARRILDFGKATYPQYVNKSRNAWLLKGLLALGPLGPKMADIGYRSYKARHQNAKSH